MKKSDFSVQKKASNSWHKIILYLLIIVSHTVITADFTPFKTHEESIFPGVQYKRYYNEEPIMEIHVMEIDNDAREISFHVQSAHNQLRGRQTLPDMVESFQERNEECTVIGAINADFFANHGIPINILIEENFFKHSSRHWSAVLFEGLTPVFDILQTQVNMSIGDENLVYSHVNTLIPAQHPVLITSHYYQFPIEVEPGIFSVHSLEKEELLPYKKYTIHLDRMTDTLDSLEPDEVAVFWPNRNKKQLLQNNPEADIEITFLGRIFENITQATGGGPMLVKNRRNVVEKHMKIERFGPRFATHRHPRTGIGYNIRKNRTFFVVVDGRQAGYSMGINLYDFADFFIDYLDCDEAINLDGGGSSTFMVRDSIKNKPSDNSPRSISTAILLCSTASADDPEYLVFPEEHVMVFPGMRYPLSVIVKDRYYNPLSIDSQDVEWSLHPSTLGSIAEEMVYFAEYEQEGILRADYHGLTAELPVIITEQGNFILSDHNIKGYSGQLYPLEFAFYDKDGRPVTFSYEQITLSDPSILELISDEKVLLREPGQGNISFYLGAHAQQLSYQIGTLREYILDDFSDHSRLLPEISGQNYNEENSKVMYYLDEQYDKKGLQVEYEFTGSGTSAIYLDIDYVLPDKEFRYIGLNIKGDGNKAWLRGVFEDADEEKFLLDFTSVTEGSGISWTDWKKVALPYDNVSPYWSNPDAEEMTFPLKLTTLYLVQPNPEYNVHGSVIIDSLFVEILEYNVKGETP